MIEKVTRPRYRRDAWGFFYLVLELDGRDAELHYEQGKLAYGALHLVAPREADYNFEGETVAFAAVPEDGREAFLLRSATNDPRVLEHFRRYVRDYDAGTIQVGPVLEPA